MQGSYAILKRNFQTFSPDISGLFPDLKFSNDLPRSNTFFYNLWTISTKILVQLQKMVLCLFFQDCKLKRITALILKTELWDLGRVTGLHTFLFLLRDKNL